MNAQQRVEQIRDHFQHEIDKSVERGIFPLEFKQFTVTPSNHGTIYVVVEVGGVGDEGTAAALFCREHRHIAVGRRGGLHLLNAKLKTRAYGWFNAIHGRTEY